MTLLLLLSPFYKVGVSRRGLFTLFTRFEGLVGGGAPNGTSPAANRSVPETTWHEPSRFESDKSHRTHGFCKNPGVSGGMGNVEQIEQSARADARYVGRQDTFEHPLPRVRTLLSLLSGLIHSSDPAGCDLRHFTHLHLPQMSYERFDVEIVKGGR